MKLHALLCGLALAGLTVAGSSYAEEAKDSLEGVKCPVSGKAVDAAHTVDYKKGKVYFCCPNCPKAFKENTKKFAAKANHQLVATDQYTQKACPLTGRPTKDDKKIEVQTVTVNFCCPNCLAKAEKSDDKVNLLFANKSFKTGFEQAKTK